MQSSSLLNDVNYSTYQAANLCPKCTPLHSGETGVPINADISMNAGEDATGGKKNQVLEHSHFLMDK